MIFARNASIMFKKKNISKFETRLIKTLDMSTFHAIIAKLSPFGEIVSSAKLAIISIYAKRAMIKSYKFSNLRKGTKFILRIIKQEYSKFPILGMTLQFMSLSAIHAIRIRLSVYATVVLLAKILIYVNCG